MGPLFWYEMRRVGRRSRLFILRLAFLAALGYLCSYTYEAFEERLRREAYFGLQIGSRMYYGRQLAELPPDRVAQTMARLGHEFLFSFLAVEAVVLMLLAPLLVASALEEERRQRTLELLLTTHLTPGQIVMGKALPRVLLLGTLVLGGLAIPAIAQLQGGIDAQLVLASTLVLLSGLLSQTAVTLWHAVRGSSFQTVLLTSYLLLAAWVLVGLARLPAWLGWLDQVLIWTNAARMLRFLSWTFENHGELGTWPWNLGLVHALVHGVLAMVLMWLAGRSLRGSLERAASTSSANPSERGKFWSRRRPAFSEHHALLWKERGASSRAIAWGWYGIGLTVLAAFVVPRCVQDWTSKRPIDRNLNSSELAIFALVTLLVPTALASIFAAWSVRREAERSTWDTLMVTPLRIRDLIRAKWQASFLAVARPAAVLIGALGLYLLLFMLELPSFRSYRDDTLVATYFVLALNLICTIALAVSLGLLMSVLNRTGMRAMVATFVALASFAAVPMLASKIGNWNVPHAMAETIIALASVIELAVLWLGLPLLLLLAAGFFSARWRRILGLMMHAVVFPLMAAFLLQLPIVLVLASLAFLGLNVDIGEIVALLSPVGLVLKAASEIDSRGESFGPHFLLSLSLNSLLALLMYLGARFLAERRGGRIDGARPRVPKVRQCQTVTVADR